jgi:hypothetical protein
MTKNMMGKYAGKVWEARKRTHSFFWVARANCTLLSDYVSQLELGCLWMLFDPYLFIHTIKYCLIVYMYTYTHTHIHTHYLYYIMFGQVIRIFVCNSTLKANFANGVHAVGQTRREPFILFTVLFSCTKKKGYTQYKCVNCTLIFYWWISWKCGYYLEYTWNVKIVNKPSYTYEYTNK